jgi:trans-aconitate 2-methyltransferase
MQWDPETYARYRDERGRPFFDLLARVAAESPRRVVDLGCGPGQLTITLADRWPDSLVEGLDSSPEMIARAREYTTARVSFAVADAAHWIMPSDADVVLGNAVLQWVPGHLDLLRHWAAALPAGGWLAFQVPGNFQSPSHRLLRELAESPRWQAFLDGVLRHDAVAEPSAYADLLLSAGLAADVWETTYLHVLPGADPVLEWMRGTGLRPVLHALSAADGERFAAEYGALLRAAYPRTEHGTMFEFRRIFLVGHKR